RALEQEHSELRNEAIACMVLPDLWVSRTWLGNNHLNMSNAAFDAGLERYATSDDLGNIAVRRVADDSEILRIANTQARPEFAWSCFSPDGRFFAIKYRLGKSSRIVLWDLSSNKRIGEVPARLAAGEPGLQPGQPPLGSRRAGRDHRAV